MSVRPPIIPAARQERFLDNQTFPKLNWTVGPRTRKILLWVALGLVFVLGPMIWPVTTDTPLMRPHYWLHDHLYLPLKGRLWDDPWPGSALAVLAIGMLLLIGLFLRRLWAQMHLGVAEMFYDLSISDRLSRLWARAFGGRLPLGFMQAHYDLRADHRISEGEQDDRAAMAVELPLIRQDAGQHFDPMHVMTALLRTAPILQSVTSKNLADRILRACKTRSIPAEDQKVLEVATSLCRSRDENTAETAHGWLTAQIASIHQSAAQGADGMERWSDHGALAQGVAQMLNTRLNDPALLDAWFNVQARSQFTATRRARKQPATPPDGTTWAAADLPDHTALPATKTLKGWVPANAPERSVRPLHRTPESTS